MRKRRASGCRRIHALADDAENTGHSFNPDPDRTLDADQARSDCATLYRVRKLDHERRLEVAAVGYQGRMGVDFVLDRRRVRNSLDPQQLLELLPNGLFILENQYRVLPHTHRAGLAMRQGLRMPAPAITRVSLRRHQIAGDERAFPGAALF